MTILNKYKEFLDAGTNEGLRYNDETKSRFVSFSKCLELLNKQLTAKNIEPMILELGTCRSFVDGKFEGCNSDDKKYWQPNNPEFWDWGAGCFSILMRLCLPNANIVTLDLIPSHLERCKHMHSTLAPGTENKIVNCIEYPNGTFTRFSYNDSVDFLTTNGKNNPQNADLIYIDTGDMWPIQPTCELQLAEAKAIVENDILAPGGIILIDDVLNGTPREQGDVNNKLGKSELSIPYLLANGFEIVFEGYQYILQKKLS